MVQIYTNNWELNNIETIIWDKDGTIVDQHEYWGEVAINRVHKTFEIFGIDTKYEMQMIYDLGYDTSIKKLTHNSPIAILSRPKVIEFFQNALKSIGYDISTDIIDNIFTEVHKDIEQNIENYVYPFEEVIDFIKKIHNYGIRQFLITSDGRNNTIKTLNYLGISNYFEAILAKEDCDEPKETGKILNNLIKQYNINKDRTISIGDTKSDWEMGKNAGIKGSILAATGQVKITELNNYSNFCIEKLTNDNINICS